MTTWRPIPGWEGYYEASDAGLIRSVPRTVRHGIGGTRQVKERVLRPSQNHKGYQIVVLARDGNRHGYAVHRLVAETFLGPLPDGWHTCHIDGDNQNNAPSNLRYATPAENNLDIVRHGRNHNVNKTHCPQGHPYTPENTQRNGGQGGRKCLTCHRERTARRRAAQRAARFTKAA